MVRRAKKAFAPKPDNPSSAPRTHKVEGQNQLKSCSPNFTHFVHTDTRLNKVLLHAQMYLLLAIQKVA